MHAKCLPVQLFGEKVSMLQVRPHMNDSKFPVHYTLPQKVVANAYALRVWRGDRIIGQVQRAYVILENGSAPYVAIRKDKTPDVQCRPASKKLKYRLEAGFLIFLGA